MKALISETPGNASTLRVAEHQRTNGAGVSSARDIRVPTSLQSDTGRAADASGTEQSRRWPRCR